VWIVHAFKKDAARGNKTRKHEMDLAKQRVEALLAKHATRH
jgi:phage-related protein